MAVADPAADFLSNIELYGRPALGGGKVDLFEGGFNKDTLSRFWLGHFAPFAIESARQKARANRVLRSEGAVEAFNEQEERGQQAFGQFGGNPELFLRGVEQRRSELQNRLTSLGAESESEFASDVFGSVAGASQQAAAAVLHQKSLDQQRYLAEQARKAIKKARSSAKKAGYIQAAGAIISAFGGIYGSAFGAAAGAGLSAYGGAQAGAYGAEAQAYGGGLYPGAVGQGAPPWTFWGTFGQPGQQQQPYDPFANLDLPSGNPNAVDV